MKRTVDWTLPGRSELLTIGISTMVGLITGVVFGVAVHNVTVGIILGIFIGSGVGVNVYEKYCQDTINFEQGLWASTPLLVLIVLTIIVWLDILT